VQPKSLKFVAGLREKPAHKHKAAPDDDIEQIEHLISLRFFENDLVTRTAKLAGEQPGFL
jgi:hypothetical protein